MKVNIDEIEVLGHKSLMEFNNPPAPPQVQITLFKRPRPFTKVHLPEESPGGVGDIELLSLLLQQLCYTSL